MADDWENIVIETGVDTLLNYLVENQEAPVSQISDDLGVSEDRIKGWATALEEEGFLEKKYSARKGMILRYTTENREEAEKRIRELQEEIDDESERVQEELESRGSEIEEAKKELKEMAEEIGENREEEEEVKQKLEELEDLEEKIEERLEKQRQKEEKLHSESVDLLSRIDSALNRIDEAEETAERFEEREQEIKKKIKALKKLEEHAEKADEVSDKLESLERDEEEAEGTFKRFRKIIDSIFSGDTDFDKEEEVLDRTVEDVKEKVTSMEDPDYKRLVKAEKNGRERKTLINWLEARKYG